jgi:hypothetical protein
MMYKQKDIIAGKLRQLEKMSGYLAYSSRRMREREIAEKNLRQLEESDAEILAAFRARFSEYQEHIGKLLKSIALEEGVRVIGISDVLAFAEKAGLIDREQDWKIARDIRNAINHDYEEDAQNLSVLVGAMLDLVVSLTLMHRRAEQYCVHKLSVAFVADHEQK